MTRECRDVSEHDTRHRVRWLAWRLAWLAAPVLYLLDWFAHATGIGHIWGPF